MSCCWSASGGEEKHSKAESTSVNAAAANLPVGVPFAASTAQLSALAGSLDYPVYWAGSRPGFSQEATRTDDGRVFIRYLPEGASIGTKNLDYAFIATYPRNGAFGTVRRAVQAKGAVSRKLPDGGLVVVNKRKPLILVTAQTLPSPPAFFAYPGANVIGEAYESARGRALQLVVSGRVRPIR